MRLPEIQRVSLRVSGAVEWITFMWRVLAVLVIGAMLAHWTWLIFAPRSNTVLPAMQADAGISAEHLFGIAAVSAVSGVTTQAALPNVRLVGVFAGTPGFAVLELDGKRQLGLAVGQDVVTGAKLVEVAIDHVVIERGGVRQQISLEGKTNAIKSATAASVQTIPLPVSLPVIVPVVAAVLSASAVPDTAAKLYMSHGRGGL